MVKAITSIGTLVLLSILVAETSCGARPFVASPILKEAILPEPPQQRAAWTAPKADVPASLLAATTRLFREGLADPRGCDYRTISVGTGSCWSGDAGVVECHGWVLPAKEAAAQRFAVCWNGMVYPVVSVGDKADLKADIKSLAPFGRFGADCPPEGMSVSEKFMLPLKVCLLLRLGEGDLAVQAWKKWTEPLGKDAEKLDLYAVLSNALEWSMFDRAICADMCADDRLSLLSAEAAARLNKSIGEEIAARRSAASSRVDRSYLDVLPALIADEQRRVKETARAYVIKKGERAFANKAAWVAALVTDLDQVAARQNGQPGGVELASDEIVEALIGCGDDAVEPLLECLEHDNRLTRSVHFWRNFSPHRMPIGVSEAAYVALSGILQTSFFGTGATGDDLTAHGAAGRKAVAGSIRAYWNKYKGLPLDERWFQILANDSAGAEQWLQAMSNITRPVDVSVSPSSMFGTGWVTVPNRKPGEKPPMRGEKLRSKQNPSVIDLTARRIEQIDQQGIGSSVHDFGVVSASDMALELADWDPVKAIPILKKQLDYCVVAGDSEPNLTDRGHGSRNGPRGRPFRTEGLRRLASREGLAARNRQ